MITIDQLLELKWQTEGGKVIKAKDMTISHIKNAIAYTQRRLDKSRSVPWQVKKHSNTIELLTRLLKYKEGS